MKPVFEDSFRICTWDSDAGARLTPSAAFNFCQEAAGAHAQELGVGIESMGSRGTAWILSRMSLAVDRRPFRGESVRVRTWPRGADRLFVRRDYELLDSSGTVFARGRSAWLIVDLASKRPRRPEALIADMPKNEGLDAMVDGAAGLEPVPGLLPVAVRTAAYSDLDYNAHVNNARYVQWLQDATDADTLTAADSFRLDLNYLSELAAGDRTTLLANGPLASPTGGMTVFYEGRREADGVVAFRAKLALPDASSPVDEGRGR